MLKKIEQQVLDVLIDSFKHTDTVTTLDIKEELRKRYPTERWYQSDVSSAMNYIYASGALPNLQYNDNGKYREYNIPQVKPTYNPATVSYVAKTKLLEVLKDTKGRFFAITWIKKDGTERTINGKVTKLKFQNSLGYIVVKTKDKEYKLVDPRTLVKAIVNGINYIVK